MDKREQTIRAWFEMWLQGSDAGVEELFDPDAVYIESWGPEYHGLPKIRHWVAGRQNHRPLLQVKPRGYAGWGEREHPKSRVTM